MTAPLNVWDYEVLAAERLDAGAHGYYAGGAGDELTLRWNVEAFTRWQLRPRVLVDVSTCSTATRVLGHELSMPLVVAPVAFQRVAHPDGEVGMARAAAAVGAAMCLSTMSTSSPADVAATGVMRWFQLYVFTDEGITGHLVRQAVDNGFTALVLTVDTPVLGRRERDFRTGFTIPTGARGQLARPWRRNAAGGLLVDVAVRLVAGRRATRLGVGSSGAREGCADA